MVVATLMQRDVLIADPEFYLRYRINLGPIETEMERERRGEISSIRVG